MDDVLEDFIRERKARVAEDKATLEELPYMEMKINPHRTYESTAKENIPPNSAGQEREEGNSMSFSHGPQYERKKQRLQQELHMDYRRNMAQKDAATLTEDSSRSLHLTTAKTAHPEVEEEPSSGLIKRHERLTRAVDQDSEEETLNGERELRHAPRDIRHEKRRSILNGCRETDNQSVAGQHGRISQTRTIKEDIEFATGLIIGTVDTEEVVQKRKERYRKELLEQMAEQLQNKRREKYLDLRVAATGANDPEKQLDRIRQFALNRRCDPEVLEHLPTGERETSLSRALCGSQRVGFRDGETRPPELPRVAFQSPLLEYSAALGLGGDGLSPSSQSFPTTVPTVNYVPRIPAFPPYLPSSISEAYRSPSGIPHHYYGTRNLLDPYAAYYGHVPVPGATFPMSYWNMPPRESVHSQFGNHRPQSQHSESSLPITLPNESAVHMQGRVFPPERSTFTRERIVSYREALKQQIRDQQEQRRREKEEKERQEAQLEADMKSYEPWGRGGGGAPLRDSTGNLIADLKQMRKVNEEAYSNPEQRQKRTTAASTAHRVEHLDPNERVFGFTHVQNSQFARRNVFSSQRTEQQVQEQDKYKACLKQQIEEKQRKKAEEAERDRLEEEKEERRFAEQSARIQREFEEEQERKRRKEAEQKAKNEEVVQLAEQKKNEAERKREEEKRKREEEERKRKEAEEKEKAAIRKQYERERQARVEEIHRSASPPIPTLQKILGPQQQPPRPLSPPRPPTVDRQLSTASVSERSLSGLASPPVPARWNQLRAAGDHPDVFSELSAVRRQLRSKQKRLEDHLQRAELEGYDSPLDNRDRSYAAMDVFDMARLRLQAPVRRPNSRNIEPANLMRIHDSLQLNYTADDESRLGSSKDPKLEEMGGANTKRWDLRDPDYRSQPSAEDDLFDLSPPNQNDYQRSVVRRSARGSLLESVSAFIDPLGEVSPVPQTPEPVESSQMSARERRRWLAEQEQAALGQRNHHSAYDGDCLQQEAEHGADWWSRNTTRHSRAVGHHGNKAGSMASPPRISTHNHKTVASEAWMLPHSSDPLKCLDRPWTRTKMLT
ncbi:centrosome and spindle pole-associated protein 1-like isoform X3 [Gouania willdenowi]|uniref:centrosome and spindle pole-associated protein 1-like isoform X3 n=1 Tax=Gouania willdenowi TaxID=441366 RepID=UPI001055BED2|nr:centrosome and spindle pole-associated protein 1-like isoform X3 [Gouania willdenowi]